MKAYIAAPIFNDHQRMVVDEIKALLEHWGMDVFSPYHHSKAIFKGRKPSDCTEQERKQVLIGNIEGLVECELLLAWVGGGSSGHDQSGKPSSIDTGVVWEMGYFACRSGAPAAGGHSPNPHGVTLAYIHEGDERQSMNLMLAGTVDAVAKGSDALADAIAALITEGANVMASQFNPVEVLAEDQEPLV